MNNDIHITSLIKPATEHGPIEVYLWIWNEPNRCEVARSLGRFASNPELSLTWLDAARISQKLKETECVGR